MKSPIKPRWLPTLGWVMLILVGLLSAQSLYQRPSGWRGGGSLAPAGQPAAPDTVEQALKSLSEVKASAWMQGRLAQGDGGHDVIAPAPEVSAVVEASSNLETANPSLKGVVVVRSGKRMYLVLGAQRYRVGDSIGTGETIRALSLQSVDLMSPEGRVRKVDIGRGIGPAVELSAR